MKVFYISVLILISVAIYLLLNPNTTANNNIITQKFTYTPYIFEGLVDADTVQLFKPSILFDNDVKKYKDGAYYNKFEIQTIKDMTKTIESFMTVDESFLAIDECTYDFDGNLISQSIKKYDNPHSEFAVVYKTETITYGI
jgi:hypothetical protein